MLFIIIPIAVVIGFLIAKYYKPKNKSEKIRTSVLIPLISGVLIHLLVASCRNSGYGFVFDLGATMLFVIIPEVALLITLFIKLKVENVDKNEINESIETFDVPLHYGAGENRVDFELQLTKEEMIKLGEMRREDPDRWEDNDLELVKAVKNALQIEKARKQETTCETKDPVEESIVKNGLASDSDSVDEPLIVGQIIDDIKASETNTEPIVEKVEEKLNLFGNKLESEYRREALTNAHWIRQNGTEMCINIDDATYREMVKLQSRDPKRWVDKELDLFHKAMKMVPNSNKPNKKTSERQFLIQFLRELKWYYILASLFGAIITYSVVASVINHNYAECDENQMISLYIHCNNMKFVNCDCTVFRYRMISSQLYRKKIHNKIFSKTKESYDRFEQQLKVSHNIENPFYWLW